jgi:hypothetical protein
MWVRHGWKELLHGLSGIIGRVDQCSIDFSDSATKGCTAQASQTFASECAFSHRELFNDGSPRVIAKTLTVGRPNTSCSNAQYTTINAAQSRLKQDPIDLVALYCRRRAPHRAAGELPLPGTIGDIESNSRTECTQFGSLARFGLPLFIGIARQNTRKYLKHWAL